MRLWLYYATHTAVNHIKRLFSVSTLVVILLVLLGFGVIGGGAGFILGFVDTATEETVETETGMEDAVETEAGAEETMKTEAGAEETMKAEAGADETMKAEAGAEETMKAEAGTGEADSDAEDESDEDAEMTAKDLAQMRATAACAVLFIVYFLLALSIVSGEKNGADIFIMGDVNFLFPAPLRPQSVLLFRLSFSLPGVIVGAMYVIFQAARATRSFKLGIAGIVIPVLGVILLLMLMKVFQVFSYIFFSAHQKGKVLIRPCLIGGFVLLLAIAVMIWLGRGGMKTSFFDSLAVFAANPVVQAVPFIGWGMALVWHLLGAHIGRAVFLLLLNVAGMGGLMWFTWSLEADFYEDALGGVVQREAEMAASTEKSELLNDEEKEKRAKKLEDAEKQGRVVVKGEGAEVFYYKNLLEDVRLSDLGFLRKALSGSLIISILVPAFFNSILNVGISIGVVVVILALITMLFNVINPVEMELDTNFFVMVPESPVKKVFAVASAGLINQVIWLILPVLAAGFLCDSGPGEILVSFLFLTSFYGFLMTLGIAMDFLLPPGEEGLANSLVSFILRMTGGGLIFGGMILGWILLGFTVGAAIATAVSAILCVVFFFIGAPRLHDGR